MTEPIDPSVAEAIAKNMTSSLSSLGLVKSAYDKYTVKIVEHGYAILQQSFSTYQTPLGPITEAEYNARVKRNENYNKGKAIFEKAQKEWEALGYYHETECGASCCD